MGPTLGETMDNKEDLTDKSYVGMANCFFCGEPKYLLLDRRLKPTFARSGVYDQEPCDKCKEFMTQGIILISVRDGESGDNPYRTGGWVVIKEEAAKKMFTDDRLLGKVRCIFVEDTTWDKLGLPRGKQTDATGK